MKENIKEILKDKRIIILAVAIVIIIIVICIFMNSRKPTTNNKPKYNYNSDQAESIKLDPIYLNIIGLTENGYNRIDSTTCISCDDDMIEKFGQAEYVVYDDSEIIKYFIGLDGDEIIFSELSKEETVKYIRALAIRYNFYKEEVLNDGMDNINDLDKYACIKEDGICDGISKSDYLLLAKTYGLSDNGDDYFSENERYNDYYLFTPHYEKRSYAKINDSISASKLNDDIIVDYKINLEFENNEHENINKNIKFIIKLNEKNVYYLYSMINY